MEPWESTAREEIRDLLARYTWAGDRGRISDLVELFTPGGVLDVGGHGGRWEGRSQIEDGLRAVVARAAAAARGSDGDDGDAGDGRPGGPAGGPGRGAVHHHVTSTLISDLTPSSATVRSYYAVHTGIGLDHWGRYRDEVVRSGDRWLFAGRTVTVDGASAGSRFVSG